MLCFGGPLHILLDVHVCDKIINGWNFIISSESCLKQAPKKKTIPILLVNTHFYKRLKRYVKLILRLSLSNELCYCLSNCSTMDQKHNVMTQNE